MRLAAAATAGPAHLLAHGRQAVLDRKAASGDASSLLPVHQHDRLAPAVLKVDVDPELHALDHLRSRTAGC